MKINLCIIIQSMFFWLPSMASDS